MWPGLGFALLALAWPGIGAVAVKVFPNGYENDIPSFEEAAMTYLNHPSPIRAMPGMNIASLLRAGILTQDDLYYPGLDIDDRHERTKLTFPELTDEQRKIVANPSHPEYTAPFFGNPNKENDESPSDSDEEVAEDPFTSNTRPKFPKKASYGTDGGEAYSSIVQKLSLRDGRLSDKYFIALVGSVTAGLVGTVLLVGIIVHRFRRKSEAAKDVEYPAYGVTGPGKGSSPTSGDKKLAQNAHLFHYQHQKQQMIAVDRNGHASDADSDYGEDDDRTVYECPGLAPTDGMEVRNPMFGFDSTPKANEGQK